MGILSSGCAIYSRPKHSISAGVTRRPRRRSSDLRARIPGTPKYGSTGQHAGERRPVGRRGHSAANPPHVITFRLPRRRGAEVSRPTPFGACHEPVAMSLTRKGAADDDAQHQRGASMVEFVIAGPTAILVTLALIQLGMMMVAKHVLNEATFEAARVGATEQGRNDAGTEAANAAFLSRRDQHNKPSFATAQRCWG